MIHKLIKHLKKRPLAPPLSRELWSAEKDSTMNEITIIASGHAKDAAGARRLMDRYDVTDATDLLPLLPKIKPINYRYRLYRWLCSIAGELPYDPHKNSEKPRKSGGIIVTNFKETIHDRNGTTDH